MRLILIILVFIPGLLSSQDLHIKNTNFNVTKGLQINIDRSIVNRGTINNEGVISVRGNWVNTGVYNDNLTGELEFDGTDLQYINHGEQPLNNLTLVNGRKHLSTNTYVRKKLHLDQTQLFVPPGSELHLEEGIELIYNKGDRVIGTLFMKGNDVTFPVGTPNRSLPLRIKLPEGQSFEMGVQTTAGLLSPQLDNTISLVSDFYWELMIPKECDGGFVTLGFEEAGFLKSIENAIVGEAENLNSVIRNSGALELSGTIKSGTVTSSIPSVGPFFTLARKYTPDEKPPVNVLNLITPNQDGYNDFLLIENIEAYPDNKVSIFDRWGTKLFEVRGYNNGDVRFDGVGNRRLGKGQLLDGTYFYLISSNGEKLDMGFFELMR